MILVSAGVNILLEYRQVESIARAQAEAIVDYIDVMGEWNRSHDGIYYKRNASGKDTYSWINSYMMMAELSQIANKEKQVKFRITSLKPLNQRNAPTGWESESLKLFENGVKQTGGFIENDTRYRFMMPLYTSKECLQCHGHQGYKVGDVRGGISIDQNVEALKAARTSDVISILMVHLLVLILSAVIFWIYLNNLKRMQALEVRRQMAEASNQFKTDFISTIGHELRTPLNAITGLTSSLDIRENQSEISLIQQAANKLEMLINQMINLSKIDEDDYPVNLAEASVETLLNDLAQAHKAAAFKKGLVIETDIDQQVPRLLKLDKDLLLGVLNPIVDNAVKFTGKENGKGKVKLVCGFKSKIAGKNQLIIKVIDNGSGFDKPPSWYEENQLSQSEHFLNRKHGGLGMGLTLARKIIKVVKGSIKIETRKGEGSTVTVTMPVKLVAGASNKKQSNKNAKDGSKSTSASPASANQEIPVLTKQELLELVELIKSLREKLQGGDISVMDTLNESEMLFKYFAADTEQLKDQVENFEFESALETLNELVEQLKQVQQSIRNNSV